MDKAGFAILGTVARVHSARLKIAADGNGGDLAIAVLARQPDLDVIGLLRGKPHVAGAERNHAIGKF